MITILTTKSDQTLPRLGSLEAFFTLFADPVGHTKDCSPLGQLLEAALPPSDVLVREWNPGGITLQKIARHKSLSQEDCRRVDWIIDLPEMEAVGMDIQIFLFRWEKQCHGDLIRS